MLLDRKMVIKGVLYEYHGNQINIDLISNSLTDNILDNIDSNFNILSNNYPIEFVSSNELNVDDVINDTGIKVITTKLILQLNNENIIAGQVSPNQIKLLDNNVYDVSLTVKLKINSNNRDQLKPEILKVVSHELHHIFREVKLLNKKSKTRVYNKTLNSTKFSLLHMFKDHPILKEFMDMFYLNLEPEITARVQETATIINTLDKGNSNEIIEYLMRFQPINDAKKMSNYTTSNIKKINNEILVVFILEFNKNLKHFSGLEDLNVKQITDIDTFFSYWEKVINKNGIKLYKKILKLISDKLTISEQEQYETLNLELINEITGVNI